MNQSMTLSCADGSGGSGCSTTAFRIDGGAWVTGTLISLVTDGNHRIDYNSADMAGNREATKTAWCAIDKAAPTVSAGGCASGWSKTNQSVTLNCVDSTSGCAATTYRLDSGALNQYSSPFSLTTDGNHRIDYNSRDAAGNPSAASTAYCAIDKAAPSTSAGGCDPGWHASQQTITFSCTDPSPGSGCASTKYRVTAAAG